MTGVRRGTLSWAQCQKALFLYRHTECSMEQIGRHLGTTGPTVARIVDGTYRPVDTPFDIRTHLAQNPGSLKEGTTMTDPLFDSLPAAAKRLDVYSWTLIQRLLSLIPAKKRPAQADMIEYTTAIGALRAQLSGPERWRVFWVMDSNADTPQAAAQAAWDALRESGSIANVFTVVPQHSGPVVGVDLNTDRLYTAEELALREELRGYLTQDWRQSLADNADDTFDAMAVYLHDGFTGYAQMSTVDLRKEATDAGWAPDDEETSDGE